jgi:hypothetical protein
MLLVKGNKQQGYVALGKCSETTILPASGRARVQYGKAVGVQFFMMIRFSFEYVIHNYDSFLN